MEKTPSLNLLQRIRRASSDRYDAGISAFRIGWVVVAVIWAGVSFAFGHEGRWLALCAVPTTLIEAYIRFYCEKRTPFVVYSELTANLLTMTCLVLSAQGAFAWLRFIAQG